MNPPLDIIPDEEWFCSQCCKTVNFSNNFLIGARTHSTFKVNLRERHHNSRDVRIFTRSFYSNKPFEYKELDDEGLFEQVKEKKGKENEEVAKRKTRSQAEKNNNCDKKHNSNERVLRKRIQKERKSLRSRNLRRTNQNRLRTFI